MSYIFCRWLVHLPQLQLFHELKTPNFKLNVSQLQSDTKPIKTKCKVVPLYGLMFPNIFMYKIHENVFIYNI